MTRNKLNTPPSWSRFWLALGVAAAGLALATHGDAASPYQGYFEGSMHSYCPSFDYTDTVQITVGADGAAAVVVPAHPSGAYNSQGQVQGDGTITGLSIRVNSLSRGNLTIAYSARIQGGNLAGSGRAGDIQVDVSASQAATRGFFSDAVALGDGAYYLQFVGGNPFGYYSYLSDPHYIYHFDLGYEYVFDAADGHAGVYLYDFKSGGFFYTSPSFPFPYLYDFSLNTVLYYFPDPKNPGRYNTDGVRYFSNLSTGQIISK